MKPTFIKLSNQLRAAIDAARGSNPLAGFVERELSKSRVVRAAAKKHGITLPNRPLDGRVRE